MFLKDIVSSINLTITERLLAATLRCGNGPCSRAEAPALKSGKQDERLRQKVRVLGLQAFGISHLERQLQHNQAVG